MALQLLPDVHTRLLAGRPGIVGRDPASWRHLLTDPNPHIGRELGPLQILLHESAASADGYVLYRVGGTDGRGLRRGTLRISEMVATTPEAAQDLWRHCLDVDLVDRVEANWGGARPLDDPLFWLARDPQAIDARLSWTLWIRLLDVPKAMELRSYRADGTLVMEVQNGGGGADRLQLTVASGRARCTPTSLSPDLSLNLSDLGSAYLGNRCLAEKARAGAVAEITAGAAPAADALLSWDPPPWCFEDL